MDKRERCKSLSRPARLVSPETSRERRGYLGQRALSPRRILRKKKKARVRWHNLETEVVRAGRRRNLEAETAPALPIGPAWDLAALPSCGRCLSGPDGGVWTRRGRGFPGR